MFFRIAPLHSVTAAVVGLLVLVNVDLALHAQSAAAKPNALKIVVIQGEDAVNIIQQKTAVAPIVEVRDENDLPQTTARFGGAMLVDGWHAADGVTITSGRGRVVDVIA